MTRFEARSHSLKLKAIALLSFSLLATACGANAADQQSEAEHPTAVITLPVPVPIISQPTLCKAAELNNIPIPSLPNLPKPTIQATGFLDTVSNDVMVQISVPPTSTTAGRSLLHRIVSYEGPNSVFYDTSTITKGDSILLPANSRVCIATVTGEFTDKGPKINSNPVFSGFHVPSFKLSP